VTRLAAFIKRHPALLRIARIAYRWLRPIYRQPVMAWAGYLRLFVDWQKYRTAGGKVRLADFYPCLEDRTTETSFDAQYFYQAVWAFSKIHHAVPDIHVDVGSDVKFVGMLSAVVKVEFVDIRPLPVHLENLQCREGSLLNLPYATGSVRSLSSMHVLEHVGLGRYGDPVDPEGMRKACAELQRVLAPGGQLYVSVPVGRPRVQFNAHRVLALDEVIRLFKGLRLADMAVVDNHGQYLPGVKPEEVRFDESNDSDYALGCFQFVK
jgi:hypothetical protein